MATETNLPENVDLLDHFNAVRAFSCAIVSPLSDADATIQPMPDASPIKWHLAHTTWFFETFILRDHAGGYRLFDERFGFLFNSYYESEGARHARARRGMLSRPSLHDILAWRTYVDDALARAFPHLSVKVRALLTLGIHHEQQHQELMLMDILAAFSENPLKPALWESGNKTPPFVQQTPPPLKWIEGRAGVHMIGHDGAGFAYDCEGPHHQILLHPYALADRLVTNGEWLRFMEAGGYERPELWLADGWAWVEKNNIQSPLYWTQEEGGWIRFGLAGSQPVNFAEPVCHINYYEADAFARWAGVRLPTEAEWEVAAASLDPVAGNQLDRPGPVNPAAGGGMFGDVWQWTMSAFLPYPGFTPQEGAVGEYNSKFMCGQFVLKGASCATPRGHSRASYRNYYYPHMRWQFAGLRLAKDM